MNVVVTEIGKNAGKKIVENWDNNGLAFFFAIIGASVFCFASIASSDSLAIYLQLFGLFVLYMMMLRIPVYYIAEKKGFSDKSSASLGLTVCFAILTSLLLIKAKDRAVFYYLGMTVTLLFALLMVWRMNMKDSRVNVRKTFTASTVVLLAQSVFSAVLLSDSSNEHRTGTAMQALLITILLIICVYRLVTFLRGREAIEQQITDTSSVEEE